MQRLLPSPNDSPLWGWRWMVRWYVGAGLVAIFCFALAGRNRGLDASLGAAWDGAGHAQRGAACLLSYDDAPHVDPATGLVVLPTLGPRGHVAQWNDGVAAALRRDGSVAPTFRDRVTDPSRIAADFDRDPGTDVGDGSAEFAAAGTYVHMEVFNGGCGFAVPDRLRRGGADVPIHEMVLRVRGPEGGWRNAVAANVGRGRAWFPHMASMRSRTSDDGRTLWLRAVDVEGGRWIVTVDLVTGTVLQIDPDPAS